MKVILQQDVRGQGKKGQMVEVSDGYGRNFLLPRKLAVEATAENVNTMKMQDKAKAARDKAEEKRKEAESALAAVRAKLEEAGKAERKAAIAGDSDLAVFQLLFGQAQEIANKLHGLLIKAQGREDSSQAAGMQKALSKLAELIGKAAEV